MFATKKIATRASHETSTVPLFGIIRNLLIWNDAWREYSRLQKLDTDALRDMGLTETTRASITVSQIAARMRGQV